MKNVIDFAFTHWKWVVAASFIFTAVSTYCLLGIKIDNSIETLTIDNNPQLILLQQMEEEYGGNEFVVIAFKGEDIFSPKILTMIDGITREIENIKNIEKVLSLTNAYTIKGHSDELGTYPIIPEDDLQIADMEKLKKQVISNRMYRKWLYSEDGNATAIIAWITPMGNDDAARWRVVNEIQNVIDKKKDDRKFHIYGMPVYQKLIFDAMLSDQFILTAVLSALIMILLFYIFRDIYLVFMPFILISITGIWALGLLVISGSTLNFATFIIPIVVLIVCLCDSVHIMSQFKEAEKGHTTRKDLLKNIVIQIAPPIMLTSITTAVGFFSLGTSGIKPVRDFGIFTGLGVLFALGVSITLLPMIMSVSKLKEETSRENRSFVMMERILARIGNWIPDNKGVVLIFSIIAITIAIFGITGIEARQDIIDTLKENTALDEARKFIDKDMAGSCEFNIPFKGRHAYAVLEPDNLKLMDHIQDRLVREVPEVLKCVSVVDFLKEMNSAINNNNPDNYQIPSTKVENLDLLEIYDFDEDKADIKSLINSDYSQARIRMFTSSADDSVIARKAFNRSEKIIFEEAEKSDINIDFTGRPKVFLDMVDSLVNGMIKSFSFAFIVIFILLIMVFRSFGTGLLCTIINIVPAVLTFGIMGWLNIPLNMLTAMVPSIAIGIAVDDTIHFVWRLEKELQYDGNYTGAILRSLTSVGKPIITTSILICAGFSIFYFSKLTLLTEFGFLTITTVISALIADLFLAPVLFLIFKPIKIKQPTHQSRRS